LLTIENGTWSELNNEDPTYGIAFHTMTAVVSDKDAVFNKRKVTELSYAHLKPEIEGLVIFGGRDGDNQITNTVKILNIDGRNAKWTYPNCKGKAPEPRMNHSAIYYSQFCMLVIYGGRNDHMINTKFELALSDVGILDCTTYTWMKFITYGIPPKCGRYNHTATLASGTMIIFGGISNNRYASTKFEMLELRTKNLHS
jgi:hypothetical protein